ncbi:MAG: hypothetical protein J6W19_08425 [Prevotella sp.]|nr:hypothetical protein [Prevotella sp.]
MEGKNHQGGTLTTRIVCAVCFLAFSFLWLYWFQGDLLAVAQHALSGGVTHYDRTVGAIIITLVFFLLQLAVYGVTRLSRRTHALTYVPSFLALAFLSDISISADNGVEVGHLWPLLVGVLVLWIGAVWLSKQLLPFSDGDKQPTGLFSGRTWINLAQLAVMMLFVAAVGNTNAVEHFRAHAETALLRGDNREAMRVGWESYETDPQLTMLRAFALSREGLLGEKLFCYPIAGSGADLLPMREAPLLLPADSIWKHLGGKPGKPMSEKMFYKLLEHDSLANPAVADYVLCSRLIDRDLKGFVRLLPKYYEANHQEAPLPRHYCEALVLYDHLQHNGVPSFKGDLQSLADEALSQEYEQLQELLAQYPEGSEQQLQLLENYRNTYWYYYSKK